ncbi:MAG: hypothetical protein PVF58_17510 [Candidatus Methanofastidiosia archaeon]|jgi:hypothetical protein
MNKKAVVAVISFIIFFAAFSEILSIKKAHILDEWCTNFIIDRTGSPTGEIPEPEPEGDINYQILSEAIVAIQENLISEIKYIKKQPRSRIPVINSLDHYRKLFFITSAVVNNITAYATVSGYWGEKTEELKISDTGDIEDPEQYQLWRQNIKNNIETLTILDETCFEKGLLTSPEDIYHQITTYSLEGIPFLKRFFLKNWDVYTKERAQQMYDKYTEHMENNNLEEASAYLLNLCAVKISQGEIEDYLNSFFGFGEYGIIMGNDFRYSMVLEFVVLLLLSTSAAALGIMVLFYRSSLVVIVGVTTGILAAALYASVYAFFAFLLAGFVVVILKHRLATLNVLESVIISIKAGLVLFIVQYVLGVVLMYAGVIHIEVSTGLTSLNNDFILANIFVVIQILFILLFSLMGGLIALGFLRIKTKMETKQEKE